MLKGSVVVNAVVSALQSIEALTAIMVNGITAFSFGPGINISLADTISQMPAASLLVSYEGLQGGNFDKMTLWKHHVEITWKGGNQAGMTSPIGTEDVGYLIFNQPVNGTALNIRQVQLLPGQLILMDTPSFQHVVDVSNQDYFQSHITIPEIGDQP